VLFAVDAAEQRSVESAHLGDHEGGLHDVVGVGVLQQPPQVRRLDDFPDDRLPLRRQRPARLQKAKKLGLTSRHAGGSRTGEWVASIEL